MAAPPLQNGVRPALAAALGRARAAPVYHYPWPALEGDLAAAGRTHLRLIGYGSLVNQESASRTLSSEHRVPVIAAGARRLFNYHMDPIPTRYGPLREGQGRAALNVRVTYDPNDLVNGVLTQVPVTDLPALRERETDYDLKPVPFVLWAVPDPRPDVAYVLEAAVPDGPGPHRVRPDVRPHDQYYEVCREGAAAFGPEFLAFWLDTTFLADGVTSAREWERAHRPSPPGAR